MGREDVNLPRIKAFLCISPVTGRKHPRTVQELLGDSTVQVVLDTYSHGRNGSDGKSGRED